MAISGDLDMAAGAEEVEDVLEGTGVLSADDRRPTPVPVIRICPTAPALGFGSEGSVSCVGECDLFPFLPWPFWAWRQL